MKEKSEKARITWKETKAGYDSFLNSFPELKKNVGVVDVFRTMAVWTFQSNLQTEKRFLELVWVQPNLTETLTNGMLSTFFHTRGGKKRKVENDILIRNLNFENKIRLLYALNLIDQETFSKLDLYRKMRNALIHRLMHEARLGKDIDKECERFCNLGFELQDRLHTMLMDFVRAQTFPK